MNHETIEKALEAVASAHTRRMYERALKRLAGWLNGRELSYTTAREYKAEMVQSGFSPQNINAHLAALRFYVREIAKVGQMAIEHAESVCQVEGAKVKGRKLGNWLSIEEAEKLLNAPDVSTPLGLRDRAILALLVRRTAALRGRRPSDQAFRAAPGRRRRRPGREALDVDRRHRQARQDSKHPAR